MLIKLDEERMNRLDEMNVSHGALFAVNEFKSIDIDLVGAYVYIVWLVDTDKGEVVDKFKFRNQLFYLENITDQNGDLNVDVLCDYIAMEEALA